MAKQMITAKVEQGKLAFGAVAKEALKQRLAKFEGEYVSLDIKSLCPKTKPQMGYYFACVLPIFRTGLIDLGWELGGIPISEDMTDLYIKQRYAKAKNKPVELKRYMNIEDAQDFLSFAINLAVLELGIVIPEPVK
jgi:hypothetical protein